ncbi:MAG TPA: hypothetical protein VIW94_00430, partial [Acidimicrobiia bacterium]
MCVGDSHRFVDPIFSFGLYVAMKEAGLVTDQVMGWLDGKGRDSDNPFQDYMLHTERAIDMLEDMIDTFWENPLAFAHMAHRKFRPQVLDMFAGRIYDGQPVADRDDALRHSRSCWVGIELTRFRRVLNSNWIAVSSRTSAPLELYARGHREHRA